MPKHVLNSFFLALGYGVAFYLLQFVLNQRDIAGILPSHDTLLHWDAAWYHSIVHDGYLYWEGHASNSGFFSLLPWIWKALHLDAWGMAAFNLLCFSVGFAAFNSIYTIDVRQRFLWLTIPSFYFVWVPYTEALFVMLISLFFVGLIKQKRWLIWIALFCVSLTRPTTLIMAPALLITELITGNNKNWLAAIKVFFIDYALPLFAGLFFFIWYQFYCTGVWFAYFKQQEENWGHEFAWTTFPLNSMYGNKLLWLNAIALFLGFVALLLLIKYGLRWLLKNRVEEDKLFVLSCLYFTGISLVTILFNPIWGTWTTNVYDVHRYALVSPFFWVLLHRFTITNTYKRMDYVKILLLSNLFWLTFAYYQHIQYVLYFNFASVFIIMYMMLSDKRIPWMPQAVVAINFIVQVFMFQWFLQGIYPG